MTHHPTLVLIYRNAAAVGWDGPCSDLILGLLAVWIEEAEQEEQMSVELNYFLYLFGFEKEEPDRFFRRNRPGCI